MTNEINKIKGIPLSQLQQGKVKVTTKESVIRFFEEHPTEAFSIEMLSQAHFSTNIRKIIQKLVEEEKIAQVSYQPADKKKWEYVYHIIPSNSTFELKKKKDEGWKIMGITIGNCRFPINCEQKDEEVEITLEYPKKGDGTIYYETGNEIDEETGEESDEDSLLGAVRFSEMIKKYPNLHRKITITQKSSEIDVFEVENLEGERKRLSKTRSNIIGEEVFLWAGGVGFKFQVDPDQKTVSIFPLYREYNDTFEDNFDEDENENIDYETDDYDPEGNTFDSVIIGDYNEEYEDEDEDDEENDDDDDDETLNFEIEGNSTLITLRCKR